MLTQKSESRCQVAEIFYFLQSFEIYDYEKL